MNVDSVNAILVTLENTVKVKKTKKTFAKSLNRVSCLNFSLKTLHRIVLIILILVTPSNFLAKNFSRHVLEIWPNQVCIQKLSSNSFLVGNNLTTYQKMTKAEQNWPIPKLFGNRPLSLAAKVFWETISMVIYI